MYTISVATMKCELNIRMTEFAKLIDMWHDHMYYDIGKTIRDEQWPSCKVAEFCAYFARYIGLKQLETLYKFI